MRTDPLLKFETILVFKLNCPSNARHRLILESKTNNSSHLCDTTLALWQEAGVEAGVLIESESRGGLSDGNQIWHAVPTLDGLGPSGDNAHCSERSADGSKLPEYVEPGSFVPKAAVNVLALRRLVEHGGAG